MRGTNCEWIEERLHPILDDRSEPDEKAIVGAHVAVAQATERVCQNAFRYHLKTVTFSGLARGAYRASFRVGHGAVVEELEFAVE